MFNYLLIFLAAMATECVTTWWTQAVARNRFWLALLLSTTAECLSWGIFILAITTDLSLCPFAIIGNTVGTAIAMKIANRRI